jgi:hypothetical protein
MNEKVGILDTLRDPFGGQEFADIIAREKARQVFG